MRTEIGLSSRVVSVTQVVSYAAARKSQLKPPNYRAAWGNIAKRRPEQTACFGDCSNSTVNLSLVLLQLLISAKDLWLVLSEAIFHIKVLHNQVFRTLKKILKSHLVS